MEECLFFNIHLVHMSVFFVNPEVEAGIPLNNSRNNSTLDPPNSWELRSWSICKLWESVNFSGCSSLLPSSLLWSSISPLLSTPLPDPPPVLGSSPSAAEPFPVGSALNAEPPRKQLSHSQTFHALSHAPPGQATTGTPTGGPRGHPTPLVSPLELPLFGSWGSVCGSPAPLKKTPRITEPVNPEWRVCGVLLYSLIFWLLNQWTYRYPLISDNWFSDNLLLSYTLKSFIHLPRSGGISVSGVCSILCPFSCQICQHESTWICASDLPRAPVL